MCLDLEAQGEVWVCEAALKDRHLTVSLVEEPCVGEQAASERGGVGEACVLCCPGPSPPLFLCVIGIYYGASMGGSPGDSASRKCF